MWRCGGHGVYLLSNEQSWGVLWANFSFVSVKLEILATQGVIGERVMEANFSLQSSKPTVAFWGRISDERLMHVFKIEDRDFLNRVEIVLGDEYLNAQFRYQTNVDIALIFLARCFELELQDMVNWLINNW